MWKVYVTVIAWWAVYGFLNAAVFEASLGLAIAGLILGVASLGWTSYVWKET